MEREKTHRIKQELDEGGGGSIFLLLTISGTTASETISDLTTYEENPREKQIIEDRYVSLTAVQLLRDIKIINVTWTKSWCDNGDLSF